MLERKPELKPQYHDFIREYIALGHMTEVPDGDVDRPDACYLPHHPVVKESSSTTKVRVVFDGSAKTSSGHSLNEALLVGPVVQDELITIVLRFRQFPIALVADIDKMYRQVSLHPDDRPLQRIFWRFNSIEPIKAYELSTITYGLAPSSFLATRTLQQVVENEGSNFPEASRVVKKDVYVDDLISGENTVERTIQLQRDLMELLQRGGFRLRKWVSNSLEVLSAIPGELQGTRSPMQFDPKETIKTLGICWEPETDTLCFNVSVNPKNSMATKREILSTIAQLYDPLGIVSPVIVQAKILMQQLWLLCLGWDDEITPDLHQYHTFADASKDAYGACLYIRSEDANGNVKVKLLTSKSKVTPLKPISIPRLELCAALLASRLFEKVVAALNPSSSQNYFWSDSTVVLQWMKSPPRTWKTFVANRISEIQATTHGSLWLHVAVTENPADLLSRGLSADELITCKKWLHGPSWLHKPKGSWPIQNFPSAGIPMEELEQRPATVLTLQASAPHELFLRFSSYNMLINVVGFAFRFIHNARPKNTRISGRVLLVPELHAAKMFLVRLVQAEVFPGELKVLRKEQSVSKNSKLRLLCPCLDSEGVIRIGGRLQLSAESYNIRHQIVIPGFHPFTKLLIMHNHKKLIHGGNTVTLAVLRDEFWPLHGRRAIRSVHRSCFNCHRANPRPIEQPVGQLPSSRVTVNEAFYCTRVDYCGPLYLKPAHRRAESQKVYICVFVCFSTKAVHLELAGDLSTNTFLMALNRFMYRRNKPHHIYSDNGTNFIGAKNALHQLYSRLQSEPENEKITKYLAQDGIQWHLIPPRAPNFGGLWEAAVKVAKKQLNMIKPLPEPDIRHLPMNRLNYYQRIQAHSQQFWHRWRSEYLKELQTQFTTNAKRCDLAVGSVLILKDDSLPPTRWPLARILEVHPGPDDIIRVVNLQTSGGVLKRSVSKICPLPKEEE
ncbi:uncharacterized protein LOC129774271 [Toxorhynchites rutilus septentrionalis]|uniref:uncharacterized protein LOC129774271 n=1 Tax=Toxorhynchites rutilus septentrionalis TaxID=329112 RepID=UPI0024796C77|nr:uncharacterized protein LOC129774271 [Toxorhynchites rutilus septentrionalis]